MESGYWEQSCRSRSRVNDAASKFVIRGRVSCAVGGRRKQKKPTSPRVRCQALLRHIEPGGSDQSVPGMGNRCVSGVDFGHNLLGMGHFLLVLDLPLFFEGMGGFLFVFVFAFVS